VPVVDIFTDGACKGNPGPGGWGALLRFEGGRGVREKELFGGEGHTTNNRMELLAVIKALEALKVPCQVRLYTDSVYVHKGITEWIHRWKKRGWVSSAKQPVKNEDLWRELDSAITPHTIKWHWVRGHAGHIENERADVLANRGVAELLARETS